MAPHVEAGRTFDEAYSIAAKPIADAIAAQMQVTGAAQARAAAEQADKGRTPAVARAVRAGGPRPTGSGPGAIAPKSLSDIVWDSMNKAGYPG